MDDQQFRLRSDEAMNDLYDALVAAGDEHDFEADLGGALTVEFAEPPAKFVVSPNSPVKQIWVSAQMRSFKLDWDEARKAFVLAETGQTLKEVVGAAVSRQVGASINL
jgi:iron donor protein CyaY